MLQRPPACQPKSHPRLIISVFTVEVAMSEAVDCIGRSRGNLGNLAALARDLSRKHSHVHLNKKLSVTSDQINQSNHPGLIGMIGSTAKMAWIWIYVVSFKTPEDTSSPTVVCCRGLGLGRGFEGFDCNSVQNLALRCFLGVHKYAAKVVAVGSMYCQRKMWNGSSLKMRFFALAKWRKPAGYWYFVSHLTFFFYVSLFL